MLINQARNLASLPYSSLQQLQQSIQRTQQLARPGAAHRLRRPADRPGVLDHLRARIGGLIGSGAGRQRAGALAEHGRGASGCAAGAGGVVGNLDTNRTQMSALVDLEPGRDRRAAGAQAGNQLLALQAQQLADLTAAVAAQGRAQSLESAQRTSAQDQGREQLRRFLAPGPGYQPGSPDVPLMQDQLVGFRLAIRDRRQLLLRCRSWHWPPSEPPQRGCGRVLEPMERATADALVTELARCRTISCRTIPAALECVPPHLGRESQALLPVD